jgi:hypothetical protein
MMPRHSVGELAEPRAAVHLVYQLNAGLAPLPGPAGVLHEHKDRLTQGDGVESTDGLRDRVRVPQLLESPIKLNQVVTSGIGGQSRHPVEEWD